jgi:hypothetical protein
MAIGLRELMLELQCTICDEVSPYMIYDRGKTGDERAARAALNGSGDNVRRCSGSRDSFDSGGVGGAPSSKR